MDKTSSRLDKCHSKWDFPFFSLSLLCLYCELSELKIRFSLLSAYLFLLRFCCGALFLCSAERGKTLYRRTFGQEPTLNSRWWFLNANVFEYSWVESLFQIQMNTAAENLNKVYVNREEIMKFPSFSNCFIQWRNFSLFFSDPSIMYGKEVFWESVMDFKFLKDSRAEHILPHELERFGYF